VICQCLQWKNCSAKEANLLDPAHLFDEHLLNNDYLNADMPNVGHCEAGTMASEFDGALDEAEDKDEDTLQDIEVNGLDDASEPKHMKIAKKVCS
jgi:hypothetical protein